MRSGWKPPRRSIGPLPVRDCDRLAIALTSLLRPASDAAAAADPSVDVVAVELRRIPVILAMWFAVMVSSLWAAFETEVGPVLFVYNNHRSVRLGDLVFTVVAVAAASWLTALLLRPSAPGPAG